VACINSLDILIYILLELPYIFEQNCYIVRSCLLSSNHTDLLEYNAEEQTVHDMKKVLILFAHPRYEKSRVNKALLSGIQGLEGITVHDLYDQYPDFNIDTAREQELLRAHQIIVWHYPLFMYGPPAMIKQWMDLVLEHGWAHGVGGNNLEGKQVFATITTGGTHGSYSHSGFNCYTMPELLYPLTQAAHICRMTWLPPFVVQGTYRLTDDMLEWYGNQYRQLLLQLTQAPSLAAIKGYDFLNDWIADVNRKEQP